MKTFEDICKMSQKEVKQYMSQYLIEHKYHTINEHGFLYAKGDIPVLLVAHMDTVHKNQCKTIVNHNGKLSSPEGIGGDDRCGIFIIMNIVKEIQCSVLLCEDEEIGLVGANKFAKTQYIHDLGVNYIIEFDRKGNNDLVYYSCYNKDFEDFVESATGYKKAYGSCSDISVLMPASKLCGVNVSCGYYQAHTTSEYVDVSEMEDTIAAAMALIKADCDAPFEYKTISYNNSTFGRPNNAWLTNRTWGNRQNKYGTIFDDDGLQYGETLFDDSRYVDADLAKIAYRDKEIELEVIIADKYLGEERVEEAVYIKGNTKAECWMNFFIENPDISFNMVDDFCWS